ncbi:DNA-directed RNA polymerases I, II, and III subunit RPABC1 [Homalodisca vitripennis]|nr:DNA-directed RNA polymerases I, II, and III subunit RPABC1 [Homalodisca vitripennis]
MACDLNLNYEPRRVGKCGRKRKLNDRLVRKLKNITTMNRRNTTKQLTEQINEYGANVSTRTVRRVLSAEGLKACRPRKKQKITPAMAKKRLQWAKGLQGFTVEEKETNLQYASLMSLYSRLVMRALSTSVDNVGKSLTKIVFSSL